VHRFRKVGHSLDKETVGGRLRGAGCVVVVWVLWGLWSETVYDRHGFLVTAKFKGNSMWEVGLLAINIGACKYNWGYVRGFVGWLDIPSNFSA